MGATTNIEWTSTVLPDGTVSKGGSWNPIRGTKARHVCVTLSPACDHCYASAYNERFSDGRNFPDARLVDLGPARHGNPQLITRGGRIDGGAIEIDTVRLDEKALLDPIRWQRPRKIFVCSMTDVAGEWVPDSFLDAIWAVMALAPHHTFQVLTKRPARLWKWFQSDPYERVLRFADTVIRAQYPKLTGIPIDDPAKFPYPHVWVGVTVELDRYAWRANAVLRHIPAAVRWVSAEPLLGPLPGLELGRPCRRCDGRGRHPMPLVQDAGYVADCRPCGGSGQERLLDWIVTGGESGKGARPMHPAWVRELRDRCQAAGVAHFFKQWGNWLDATDTPPGEWPLGTGAQDQVITPAGEILGAGYRDQGMVAGDWRERGGAWMVNVGKHRAGRLLDGVEHSAFPIVAGAR